MSRLVTKRPALLGQAAVKELYRDGIAGGLRVRWWDFAAAETLAETRKSEKCGIGICINLEGAGAFVSREASHEFPPGTVAIYREDAVKEISRESGKRHRFLMIQMPHVWIRSRLAQAIEGLSSTLRIFLDDANSATPKLLPISSRVRRAAEEMISSPIQGRLRSIWYQAKIIEVSAHLFTQPDDGFFCERQKLLARERAEAVKRIVLRDVENPPSLPAIAREVGCSPSYLSRIFSEATGMTIMRFLRTARLTLAAERLRTGKFNVTEAAMSVGYSSLSHFSKAFAEQFGHCPCVFPFQK